MQHFACGTISEKFSYFPAKNICENSALASNDAALIILQALLKRLRTLGGDYAGITGRFR